jgi:hypothetical protein
VYGIRGTPRIQVLGQGIEILSAGHDDTRGERPGRGRPPGRPGTGRNRRAGPDKGDDPADEGPASQQVQPTDGEPLVMLAAT